MSLQSAEKFLEKVANTEALQPEFIAAWSAGGMTKIVQIGNQQGFDITDADVIAVRDVITGPGAVRPQRTSALDALVARLDVALKSAAEGALSDEQLEMVAAGTSPPFGPTTFTFTEPK